MDWNTPNIQVLVHTALVEDSAQSDLTTRLLIDPRWRVDAVLVAKAKGIVAGLPLAAKIFQTLDRNIQFKPVVRDGAWVRPRQQLALIKGRARSVLSGERPALNALQHLSGIATYTHAQVQKLKGTRTKLYDTRKTLPGWRVLQKYAVLCGGARNHRMSLGDAVMVKENHLFVARQAGSDWMARLSRSKRPLQLEIQTQKDFKDALRIKPQRVLLDNLPVRTLRVMMRTLRRSVPGIEIEITGGVKPEELRRLARLRPDRISMGRLTHSVTAFDCSLEITHVYTH